VLRLLASGLTNRQIAAELVVSVHTVERHVDNLYCKIGAQNRVGATGCAWRLRLLGATEDCASSSECSIPVLEHDHPFIPDLGGSFPS
jgi:hypothetical protein